VVKLQKQATAALRAPYDQLAKQLPTVDQLGIDETPTKEGPSKAWLWGFVANTFTVFAVRTSRAATFVETCRQQSRNAFAFITTAVEAHFAHHPAPSPIVFGTGFAPGLTAFIRLSEWCRKG
jgi:hypothetical protein